MPQERVTWFCRQQRPRHAAGGSGEAAFVLVRHNGSLGDKQFGICPHVRDLFSLRGWMYFWAGGQEINTVFRERKGMWTVL